MRSTINYINILIVLFALFIYLFYRYYSSNAVDHEYVRIRRIRWPNEFNKLFNSKEGKYLTNYYEPLIITNHSTSKWPALKKWNYKYLKAHWGHNNDTKIF